MGVFTELEYGIGVGTAISLGMILFKAARPKVVIQNRTLVSGTAPRPVPSVVRPCSSVGKVPGYRSILEQLTTLCHYMGKKGNGSERTGKYCVVSVCFGTESLIVFVTHLPVRPKA